MTTPAGLFETLGLSLNVYQPLARTATTLRPVRTLLAEIQSYRHRLAAYGGFDTAEFTATDDRDGLEQWLDAPLGQHVETIDQAMGKVWEGFVNQVTVNAGALSIVIGPLVDIGNRASVVYNAVDTTTIPPVSLGRATTTIAENFASQAVYGIWEKVYSGGTCTPADAEQLRDTFLANRAWPQIKQQVNIQPSGQPSVAVACLGYWRWLQGYVYSATGAAGVQSLSDRIKAILTADPNAIFSTDQTGIATNAFLVAAYEDDGQFASALIQAVVALGDASANRWTFGIYEDRKASYQQVPTVAEYEQRIYGAADVTNIGGMRVYPWRVRPAKWLRQIDFATGRVAPSVSLAEDPRALFIEAVDYTAPYGLVFNSGQTDILAQLLAQIGVAA